MEKKKIIITDDEAGIRQLVKVFLERYHFEVLEASTGQALLDMLNEHEPDLIVLDLMLPDMYGVDICKTIRKTSDVPIIMLTAVQGETNVVLGFEAGADDYIEKPFSAHVLLSRIQAILRRLDQQEEKQRAQVRALKPDYKKAEFGQWTYLPSDSCIEHTTGKQVFLTKNEALLLHLFIRKGQEILSRERIGEVLSLDIDEIESRAIDVQVSRLRNKLKDKTGVNLIKSIRNKGYLFSVPVKFG